jgi:hypothetical protein
MTDLEIKLAEARERVINHLHKHGLVGWDTPLAAFDAAAAVAREVVAKKDAEAANWEAEARRLHDLCDEKDAEIARLEIELAKAEHTADLLYYASAAEGNAALVAQGGGPSDGSNNIAQPRKVTDATGEPAAK